MTALSPIGIFDSGIGGVSVLIAIRKLLPNEDIIYFGDNANLPYGEKSLAEVRGFCEQITNFLIQKRCKVIVIACNTASAAALKHLRQLHPETTFVGMEPAVKPAAEQTQSGVVGVLATTATFQGELFASVVDRFAKNVKVLHQPCPGLVQQIESGKLDSAETETMLRLWLQPMIESGIDSLVLACTHYPFVVPLLKKILGEKVNVIDPAPAVAKQVKKVLEEKELLNESQGKNVDGNSVVYFTSGSKNIFEKTLFILTGNNGDVQEIKL